MKKSRLVALLLTPLMLVACSDTSGIVNENEIHDWIEKDIEVFKSLNAKDNENNLIYMPYDKDLFVTYEVTTYDETNPDKPIKSFESNYDLSYNYDTNKVYLYLTNETSEENYLDKIDHYYQTIQADENWTIDETLSSATNHDYYAYRDLTFKDDYDAKPKHGERRLNLNVYQQENSLIVAMWVINTMQFTNFPTNYLNTYFMLNSELANFIAPDDATLFTISDGSRGGYPYLDIKVNSSNANNLANYKAKLVANSYQLETYHPYLGIYDNYYINQSYHSDEADGTILQSLNVYLDKTQASDNSFTMRLNVEEDIQAD